MGYSTGEAFITQAGDRFRVRVPVPGNSHKRKGGTRGTMEEAMALRDRILAEVGHPMAEEVGGTSDVVVGSGDWCHGQGRRLVDRVRERVEVAEDLHVRPVTAAASDSSIPSGIPASSDSLASATSSSGSSLMIPGTPVASPLASSAPPTLSPLSLSIPPSPTPTTHQTPPFPSDTPRIPNTRPADIYPLTTPVTNVHHEDTLHSSAKSTPPITLHRVASPPSIDEHWEHYARLRQELDAYEHTKQNHRAEKKFSKPATAATTPILEAPPLPPAEDVWEKAIRGQKRSEAEQHHRAHRSILLPPEPIGIALTSDTHFGNPACDYLGAKADAELIRDTEGMYAIFNGDGIDNWGAQAKLLQLQRTQAVSYPQEVQLLDEYMKILADKLLVVVSGNHELWTYKAAGIDLLRHCLQIKPMIYEPFHARFDVKWGRGYSHVLRFLVRHKWKGYSIFNPTHGLEQGGYRMGEDIDVAVGGHTHIGTLFREFVSYKQKRLAILIGTYKVHDKFGEEVGFAPAYGRGCGALLLHPDGRHLPVYDLQTARDILGYWRSTYSA